MSPSSLYWPIVAVLCISVLRLTAAETITPCETSGERLADKNSCTRYHICREDDNGQFTSDIAVCTSNKVFDMVTSSCQEVGNGYLQDPEGCRTFYGCNKARANSEGYKRRHYTCPGQLRFHPVNRFCTYKTSVPDKLCNSNTATQQILGTDVPDATSSSSTTSTTTAATTTSTPTTEVPVAAAEDTSGDSAGGTRDASGTNLPKNPASLSDIDRITQVIKGQLLNRRPIVNNKVSLPIASRD